MLKIYPEQSPCFLTFGRKIFRNGSNNCLMGEYEQQAGFTTTYFLFCPTYDIPGAGS